jgi:hypothetical protein
MRHRIVSSRLLVKAHPVHIYKFLENLDNHKTLWPGVSRWEGEKDSARYRWRLGLASFNVETKIVERHPGLRICEEPVSGAPFAYRRYFKIQADDQTAVLNISIEAEMSGLQVALFHLPLKAQLEGILRNIRTTMEKPKAAPAAPAMAQPAAPAAPPAATPATTPATPPTAASS